MSEPTAASAAADHRIPPGASALAGWVDAGVLDAGDLHVADAIGRTFGGTGHSVMLAAALCVRGLRYGHVCIELDRVAQDTVSGSDASGEVQEEPLDWPDPVEWARELEASPAVATCDPAGAPPDAAATIGADGARGLRPLVFDGTRIYLERYWRYERMVGESLLRGARDAVDADRALADLTTADPELIDEVLGRYLGPASVAPEPDGEQQSLPGLFDDEVDTNTTNMQRVAADTVLRRPVTVLAGGPGTGKTHTIAHLLAAVVELASAGDGEQVEIALAAPTGKAAARMTEAIRSAVARAEPPEHVARALLGLEATTIHRLLGYRDGITFRHDGADPLPHDLVVIDETSMVALPLMARLLDALRPDARLVLVGDPFQLASVETGAVLGDVVGPAARPDADAAGMELVASGGPDPKAAIAGSIVVLERVHRYGSESGIAALAEAIRAGDADAAMEVLLDTTREDVSWVDPDDAGSMERVRAEVAGDAAEVMGAARSEDHAAALQRMSALKVLCGTRFGPAGSHAWGREIESRVTRIDRRLSTAGRWYTGRPLMVTQNDYITGVFNGDTALVVEHDGRPMAAVESSDGVRLLSPSQLDQVDTWWAMTIHKSQGSEFDHVVVSLPDATSRVLSNELLYTGITRGRERVTVLGSESAIRTAVERRVARASGLGPRLWGAGS